MGASESTGGAKMYMRGRLRQHNVAVKSGELITLGSLKLEKARPRPTAPREGSYAID